MSRALFEKIKSDIREDIDYRFDRLTFTDIAHDISVSFHNLGDIELMHRDPKDLAKAIATRNEYRLSLIEEMRTRWLCFQKERLAILDGRPLLNVTPKDIKNMTNYNKGE